ncbi:hypothetical protein BY996DRAFT_869814 [Phakopsora pachyrhizi]|uniref:Expressed protein n=2 Tax=Phakopsora pachyrhizi TaxID=170000 RepID=A0AAV0AK43_PHAPC|nr:hypothetical protein BY996DRAFT_869814 [Phakopsora pachyrhizi]CAH7668911.1 expressed protein [Phakopsora pachyrhizi]
MLSSTQLSIILALSISYAFVSAQSVANSTATAPTPTTGAGGLTAGLSPGCQAAAGGLLSTEFSSCANIIGLVSLISAQGGLIDPLSNWISGVCSASPCSSATLSTTSTSLNAGCGADIQKGVPSAIALNTVITNYNPIREMICTQYSTNSTFCATSILSNIQTATGKSITLNEVQAVVSGGLNALPLSSVPASAYCNDCGHALFTKSKAINVNTGSSNLTSASSGASDAAAQTCGASFNDGKVPSTVRVAGSTKAGAPNAGGKNKASVVNAVAMGLMALVAICIV